MHSAHVVPRLALPDALAMQDASNRLTCSLRKVPSRFVVLRKLRKVSSNYKYLQADTPPFLPADSELETLAPRGAPLAAVAQWWSAVAGNITLDDKVVIPPGPRTPRDDFVRKGLRLEPLHIASVRAAWNTFLERHGNLPVSAFEGRGVVLIGGKLQYLVPSLVALRALRGTGCTLPAELWFPDNEPLPSIELQALVRKLGAHIRTVAVPRALGHVRTQMQVCAKSMYATNCSVLVS